MFARAAAVAARRHGVRFASTAAAPKAGGGGLITQVALYGSLLGGIVAFGVYNKKPLPPALPKIVISKGGVERTFIAIKPDGVERGLVSQIIRQFERKGYKLVAIKTTVPPKELAEKHYEDLRERPFFKGLVEYMTGGRAPVVAMVWEGVDAVKQGRRIIGATNPLVSEPGTLRGNLSIAVGRNIIHGSDSFETAVKEIGLWFTPAELAAWAPNNAEWIESAN